MKQCYVSFWCVALWQSNILGLRHDKKKLYFKNEACYAYFHFVSSHCCISIYVPPFHVLNSLVLHDILKRVLPVKDDYGDAWLASRHKLLSIFREALSSCCARLVQMIQVLIMLSVFCCKFSWWYSNSMLLNDLFTLVESFEVSVSFYNENM